MASEPTLLCIPDISGFTKFMSDVNFELTSKVIPSLLNKVIYSNTLNLKVSEIEGDAVLFFSKGSLPSFSELVDQCNTFYTGFYKQLHLLQKAYASNHQAFEIPRILGLKIILHYGDEIVMTQVGNRIKLLGEDVIIAHRLLKNNVEEDEYLLISDQLLQCYDEKSAEEEFDWGTLRKGSMAYEHIGELKYHYIPLSPLVE
ncbi:DUF2652 domain-containing protein [Muricauda sp. JGD-17]|uniref:DUF2652 domain-containing protein n=1 Tax=Flagellimonas ochracea TaxID=2696472 RepID=A0A964WXD4_9FLAO|nr:DUF2652 domain-containing protein [Allomuricauda ochracea]NAY91747.1 DUF2652 domain-containing protein [Allomuricauda ochracea]